ncbi:2-isopropylmalate synthase [bacterium]|jgi:2-isopropylmalate synthase|nr:2-isopropylmalate synthase [bacterium]
MNNQLIKKYSPTKSIPIKNRTWPDSIISDSPTWCSVDLRDGNQALINPMNMDQKLSLFKLLVDIGFKEIEVGFPSAAQVEFDFLRNLIDNNLIPDDVTVQVLCQARKHLIDRTFEAIDGAKNVIFHIYNSTSTAQREIVFQKSKQEIKDIACQGVNWVNENLSKTSSNVRLQYSPESFTGTEIEYAVDVCEAVLDTWSGQKPVIMNLPATVELFTPNIYADMIEWFITHFSRPNEIIVSVHTHNDRGTGVAASEFGVMAGATRVEGTLFGNGERTGNVDIITLALNLYTQGVETNLDLHGLDKIIDVYKSCTNLPIHPRHPYVGDLVYTAFSGSHQDAIKKGLASRKALKKEKWDIPYLPIDPTDLGRTYEAVIRINSQSGKGGIAYIMENEYGYSLPKSMHPEFSKLIQILTEKSGKEISSDEIYTCFKDSYLSLSYPFKLIKFKSNQNDEDETSVTLTLTLDGRELAIKGSGNGPIDASKQALLPHTSGFKIVNYAEHSLSEGSDSKAIAYIQLESKTGQQCYGVGIDPSINLASIKALFSALNRLHYL